MKMNRKNDNQIKLAILKETDEIEPSADLFNRIKEDIYKKESGNTMKNKFSNSSKRRRIVTLVASFILLFSITVLGVTMGRSWIGHSSLKYETFPSQEEISKDVGFAPKYTESLPGGFKYVSGGTGESKLLDDDENILTQTSNVNLAYKRENEKSLLHLTITQVEETFLDNKESQLVEDLDGINLYYYQQDYKFVPPNYELTEEDIKATEAGKLEISYGASEISLSNVQGLSWYEDGLEYMIMGNDFEFAVEEMIDMAKDIIKE